MLSITKCVCNTSDIILYNDAFVAEMQAEIDEFSKKSSKALHNGGFSFQRFPLDNERCKEANAINNSHFSTSDSLDITRSAVLYTNNLSSVNKGKRFLITGVLYYCGKNPLEDDEILSTLHPSLAIRLGKCVYCLAGALFYDDRSEQIEYLYDLHMLYLRRNYAESVVLYQASGNDRFSHLLKPTMVLIDGGVIECTENISYGSPVLIKYKVFQHSKINNQFNQLYANKLRSFLFSCIVDFLLNLEIDIVNMAVRKAAGVNYSKRLSSKSKLADSISHLYLMDLIDAVNHIRCNRNYEWIVKCGGVDTFTEFYNNIPVAQRPIADINSDTEADGGNPMHEFAYYETNFYLMHKAMIGALKLIDNKFEPHVNWEYGSFTPLRNTYVKLDVSFPHHIVAFKSIAKFCKVFPTYDILNPPFKHRDRFIDRIAWFKCNKYFYIPNSSGCTIPDLVASYRFDYQYLDNLPAVNNELIIYNDQYEQNWDGTAWVELRADSDDDNDDDDIVDNNSSKGTGDNDSKDE